MRATWILIISWIIVTFGIWMAPNTNELVYLLGYSTESLTKGYIWTPITSIFIHADLLHLLMNSLAFVFFGLATEKEIGKNKMLMIFFVGAVVGDLVSSLFYSFDQIAVGASGGVSAVLGAAILVAPFRFSSFPYVIPAPIVMVGIVYVLSNIMGLFTDFTSNVSYAAHIGGLMFGLSYGFSHVGTKRGVLIILLGFLLLILMGLIVSMLFG